jgi:membrane protease YdiL (CAAX protease family)
MNETTPTPESLSPPSPPPQPPDVPPPSIPPLPPPPPKRLPVWTALTVGISAIFASLVVSTVVLIVAMFTSGTFRVHLDEEGFASLLSGPAMLLAVFLPGQCVFLLAAFGATKFSKQPPMQRLGFIRSRMPWWAIILFMLAIPFFGFLGQLLLQLVMDGMSEQLKMLNKMIGSQTGAMAVAVLVFISIAPAFTEESLFRGYVQRRLLQRWHPAAAIAVSTLLFSIAHVDPGHALGVLPIGLWLGVVAWRCGAVWPAMLCHATQNLLGVAAMLAGVASDEKIDFSDPATRIMLAVCGAAVLASVIVMLRLRNRTLAEKFQ